MAVMFCMPVETLGIGSEYISTLVVIDAFLDCFHGDTNCTDAVNITDGLVLIDH